MTPTIALIQRELRSRVRALSHFVTRTMFTGVFFFMVVVVFWDFVESPDVKFSALSGVGSPLFKLVASLTYAMLLLSIPILSGGAVASERKERALSLLLLTDLGPYQIAWGKFLALFGTVGWMVLSALPTLVICIFLGGVELMDVVRVFGVMLATSFGLAGIGLGAGAYVNTPTRAMMVPYGVLLFWMVSPLLLLWIDMVAFWGWWHPFVAFVGVLMDPFGAGAGWWFSATVMVLMGLGGVIFAGRHIARDPDGVESRQKTAALSSAGMSGLKDIWSNPVAWYEWKKVRRPFVFLLVAVALGCGSAGWAFAESGHYMQGPGTFLVGVASLVLAFYVLGQGSRAFALERKERTLEILQLTGLSSRGILAGKFVPVLWGIVCVFALAMPMVFATILSDVKDGLGVLVLLVLMGCVALLVGAMAIFFSLTSTTMFRAASFSVGTVVYLMSMVYLWPVWLLEVDEDWWALFVALGWLAAYRPVLSVLWKTKERRWIATGGAMVLFWMLLVALSPWIVPEEEFRRIWVFLAGGFACMLSLMSASIFVWGSLCVLENQRFLQEGTRE